MKTSKSIFFLLVAVTFNVMVTYSQALNIGNFTSLKVSNGIIYIAGQK